MDDIIATDKQIEQILQQITVIPEQVADGIVVIDLAGNIRFVNPAWAAIHGYSATDELIGKDISVFHTEEQMRTLVADFIEETKHRGQLAGQIEHLRSDGTVFYSQTKMTTAKDKKGKTVGLVVFAIDDTGLGQNQYHLSDQTTELATVNEQLRNQITEHENKANELKEQRDQLEQRLNQQNTELAATKEQLQDEITERQQIQQRLKQQADELIAALAANEQLQNQISEYRKDEKSLKQRIYGLTTANEKLEQMLTEQKTKAQANAEKVIANIEDEHQQQIAELKSEVDETIAREKARADRIAGQIDDIKAEAEEKSNALASQIAQLQAELAEKERANAEQIANVKAETEQTIAEEKTRADQAAEEIARIKTETEEAITKIKAEY